MDPTPLANPDLEDCLYGWELATKKVLFFFLMLFYSYCELPSQIKDVPRRIGSCARAHIRGSCQAHVPLRTNVMSGGRGKEGEEGSLLVSCVSVGGLNWRLRLYLRTWPPLGEIHSYLRPTGLLHSYLRQSDIGARQGLVRGEDRRQHLPVCCSRNLDHVSKTIHL